MRRSAAICALVFLVACGSKATTPSTTSTTKLRCLRVSDFYIATLKLAIPSNVAAVAATKMPGLWYVSTPDGALWVTTVDPTSGDDVGGAIVPLNSKALSASRFGSALGIGGPKAQGATEFDAEALGAHQCALAAERRP